MLLLAPIPAEVRDGFCDAGRGGVFRSEFFHEAAVAFVFLEELEAFGGAEDTLGVEFRIGGGDFRKLGDAFLHVALVHEGVPEEDAGFVVLGLAGEFFEVFVEFVDGEAVALELLGAVGFPEGGLAAVAAFGEFLEVFVHGLAGFLEFFRVGETHAAPIGGGIGSRVLWLGLEEFVECGDGFVVFLGLEEGEPAHEQGFGALFGIRVFRGDVFERGGGFFVAKARKECLGFHEQDFRNVWRVGEFFLELFRGGNGLRPVFECRPAADDVDGGLFGEFVRREVVEHLVHDKRGFAIALHLEVGHGEAEAEGSVEALGFLEISEFAFDILHEAGIDDPRERVGGGAFGGDEFLFQFGEAVFLMADKAFELPDTLEAEDGFAELAEFQPAVPELEDEHLEGNQLRDVRHVRVFLREDFHGAGVVAEFLEGEELEDDGSAAGFGREGAFQ